MTKKTPLSRIGNKFGYSLVKNGRGDTFAVYHQEGRSKGVQCQEGTRADCIGFIVGCVLENMSTKERRQAEEGLVKITEAA